VSIISSICADHDLEIVQKGIKKARDLARPLCKTPREKMILALALKTVKEYCQENISE
jgi:hypothetical protein